MRINNILYKLSIILLVSMLVLGVNNSLYADQKKVDQAPEESKTAAEMNSAVTNEDALVENQNKQKNDAGYWYDMGILCSVYGNDKNAIRHFNKVIKLEPENSKAYFHRGVSYGEMGQYENSLSSINKAIEIDPDNGLFYYGRGRVYLLSGQTEQAIENFKQAATMGNLDAQNYLRNVAMVEWE
ncbi:MAG: tetratricopeptide repeat protein [Desulfobacterales bacterium]|nr:tetratricopeptide repeat protein [Deltaproteobacteria bacterium]NNL42719.1 tetratricopeptide repeat protein [Desulfobacterales bacterium]